MYFALKFVLVFIGIVLFQACSSIKTETKRTDINDIIYMPHQKIERELDFFPKYTLNNGLNITIDWYIQNFKKNEFKKK